MEISDIELQTIKDMWADDVSRERAKRVIAIALGKLQKGVSLDLALSLGDQLDDMLLEKEKEERNPDKNLTV